MVNSIQSSKTKNEEKKTKSELRSEKETFYGQANQLDILIGASSLHSFHSIYDCFILFIFHTDEAVKVDNTQFNIHVCYRAASVFKHLVLFLLEISKTKMKWRHEHGKVVTLIVRRLWLIHQIDYNESSFWQSICHSLIKSSFR